MLLLEDGALPLLSSSETKAWFLMDDLLEVLISPLGESPMEPVEPVSPIVWVYFSLVEGFLGDVNLGPSVRPLVLLAVELFFLLP